MTKKADPKPRQRTWKPKTRTGCITCRIRRVKCDEAKPACVKCTSTGRKCDGYTPLSPNAPSDSEAYALMRPGLSDLPGATADERDGLYHFRIFTTVETRDRCNEFWGREVLRASHDNPAVRHAAIALGTMHKRFITGKETAVFADAADRKMRFALEQYNKAIQQTVNISSSPRPSDQAITLTVCMLFTSLSSIQGHQAQALIHLESGMKMLEGLEKVQMKDPSLQDSLPVSLPALTSIFERLDAQSRMSLSLERLQVWHPRRISIPQAPAHSFESIPAALAFFIALFYAMTLAVQSKEAAPEADLSHLPRIFDSIKHLLKAGETACMEMLLDRSVPLRKDQIYALDILAIYRVSTRLFLRIAEMGFNHTETDWDELQPEFKELFRLSCTIYDVSADDIEPCSTRVDTTDRSPENGYAHHTYPESGRPPSYTFNPGPVEPLFIVAARSRDPYLRRAAIHMMLKFPRREGIWDSTLAGRIAWEMMTVEERLAEERLKAQGIARGVQGVADIPGECRIRAISVDFDGLRTATVTFRRNVDFEKGQSGFIKRINW